MTPLFILAAFTLGIMALGHTLLALVMNLPFKGFQAVTYWVLVGGFITFGVLAIISHHIQLSPGAYA